MPGRPLSAPQALASTCSSVQLKNALWGSVWLVSHHQPSGAAAYNRDAYVGQQGGFVKGRLGEALDRLLEGDPKGRAEGRNRSSDQRWQRSEKISAGGFSSIPDDILSIQGQLISPVAKYTVAVVAITPDSMSGAPKGGMHAMHKDQQDRSHGSINLQKTGVDDRPSSRRSAAAAVKISPQQSFLSDGLPAGLGGAAAMAVAGASLLPTLAVALVAGAAFTMVSVFSSRK